MLKNLNSRSKMNLKICQRLFIQFLFVSFLCFATLQVYSQRKTPTNTAKNANPTQNAREHWAKALENAGGEDIVISQTTLALKKNPKDFIALRMRSQAYFAKKEDEKGKSDAETLVQFLPNPNTPEEFEARCYAYRRLSKPDEALSDCNKSVELNPNYFWAYYTRAIIFTFDKSDFSKAKFDVNKMIEISPKSSQAFDLRGVIYYGLDDNLKAISDWNKAIALNPQNFTAFRHRGIFYQKEKDYEKAISDFSFAIKLNQKDVNSYLERGQIYLATELFEKAIRDFTQIIMISPKEKKSIIEVYYFRGLAYSASKKRELAISDFSELIKIVPNPAPVYVSRGNEHRYYADEFDAERIKNADIIKAAPNELAKNKAYKAMMENVTKAKKEYESAISDCSKAIELNPKNWEAYSCRGQTNLRMNNFASSIDDFTKLVQIKPSQATYSLRGIAYLEVGSHCLKVKDCDAESAFKLSIVDFSKAIEIDSNFDMAYEYRADAYDKIGKTSLAEADRKKAQELRKP